MSGGVPSRRVPLAPRHLRRLSFSRADRYLRCPESYRLWYVERLRPRRRPANLVFGQTVHGALAGLFRDGADPVTVFAEGWAAARELDLSYSSRDSWERLQETGERLLELFVAEERAKVGTMFAVERPFRLEVTSLGVPFVGVVDLFAEFDGVPTVIDFKTAASRYGAHEAIMSDQLTAYHLAEPTAAQSGLCVLVKTKTPHIGWQTTTRTPRQLRDYLQKLDLVTHDIAAHRFYKRPGPWCAWCDFLPVCSGDQKQAEETLVRVE